jgi:hypothetical protein
MLWLNKQLLEEKQRVAEEAARKVQQEVEVLREHAGVRLGQLKHVAGTGAQEELGGYVLKFKSLSESLRKQLEE